MPRPSGILPAPRRPLPAVSIATSPWATLDWASSRAFATNPGGGCTVWFKDGVYTGANSLYERFAAPTWFKAVNRYRAVLQNASRAVQLFGARNMVFEGFEIQGRVKKTFLRGHLIVDGDQWLGREGMGEFLKRGESGRL